MARSHLGFKCPSMIQLRDDTHYLGPHAFGEQAHLCVAIPKEVQ
jgi:hypothetical protein